MVKRQGGLVGFGLARVTLVAAVTLSGVASPLPASAGALRPSSPTAGPRVEADFVCAPSLQLRHDGFCPDQGPSSALADLARQGLVPERPLPLAPFDTSLASIPYHYRRMADDGATKTYASVADAAADKDAIGSIPPGFVYVSWNECMVESGVAVYLISSGVFIRGGSACKQIGLPYFHGMIFRRTPGLPFGWILGTVEGYKTPRADQPTSGSTHYRFEVVQIHGERTVDNVRWVMIGQDEWVQGRDVAEVDPDPRRPDGVQDDRWISIDLLEQTLAVYDKGELVFATLLSSGLPGWWTQPGVFQVYSKLEHDDMSGAFAADRSDYYYLQDVPWVLYFDKARALHGAYWHSGYGYPRSHGCVNLSPADAHWLFDWADKGTYVYVFDPSGKTPTDPADYGSGGV